MDSKNLKEAADYITEKFKDFDGFLSIRDFKSLLLLTFYGESDENMMRNLMEGSNPNRKLYYDRTKGTEGAFIIEMLPSERNLTVYLKQPNTIEKQIIKLDDKKFLGQFLTKFEQDNLIDKKGELRIIDYFNRSFDLIKKHNIVSRFEISKIYGDFLSYIIGIGKTKSIFVLDVEDGPDVVFSFMVSISSIFDEEYIPIHAYLDHDEVCKDAMFLKINKETHEFKGVSELEEKSHTELYKNTYILIIHVKSFEPLA